MTPEQHAELNAWIAENVMQWTRHIATPFMFTSDSHAVIVVHPKFTPRCPHIRFQPTTSPADAMAVLEKMLQVYGEFELLRYDSGLYHLTHHSINIDTTAPTLPLAIVLTAKQLFGKDER